MKRRSLFKAIPGSLLAVLAALVAGWSDPAVQKWSVSDCKRIENIIFGLVLHRFNPTVSAPMNDYVMGRSVKPVYHVTMNFSAHSEEELIDSVLTGIGDLPAKERVVLWRKYPYVRNHPHNKLEASFRIGVIV